ncbi:hypothetical protein AVEN_139746-1 [Araneus ventricosus]|uniref:Uncharacterized protein n=1 Tax=Araneus ventricosus TaxID=182803 RepID=A0A4Y2WEM5_ARAVE|nr:hypothetical protein AVEN_139746-1 [Araneus ventricosus]
MKTGAKPESELFDRLLRRRRKMVENATLEEPEKDPKQELKAVYSAIMWAHLRKNGFWSFRTSSCHPVRVLNLDYKPKTIDKVELRWLRREPVVDIVARPRIFRITMSHRQSWRILKGLMKNNEQQWKELLLESLLGDSDVAAAI